MRAVRWESKRLRYIRKQTGEALHTQLADEAVCIRAGSFFGELSEHGQDLKRDDDYRSGRNSSGITDFCPRTAGLQELCEKCNITFIGPKAEVIEKLGNKAEGKKYDDICRSSGHSGKYGAGLR